MAEKCQNAVNKIKRKKSMQELHQNRQNVVDNSRTIYLGKYYIFEFWQNISTLEIDRLGKNKYRIIFHQLST